MDCWSLWLKGNEPEAETQERNAVVIPYNIDSAQKNSDVWIPALSKGRSVTRLDKNLT